MVGKKGVFFTFTALLMMTIFLSSFFVYSYYREKDKTLVIEDRINTMDDFIEDIENDVENAIHITGFRSLLSLLEYMSREGTYVDDVDVRFSELFFNGTVDGVEMGLIENNTFYEWESRMKNESKKIGIELSFSDVSVSVRQDDPWGVVVGLNYTLIVGDLRSTAYWTKEMYSEKRISILNFEDPLYRIGTNGIVLNPIVNTTVPYFVNSSNNDTTYLKLHNGDQMYINNVLAPSFLKRLEGDLSADVNGIESLVNVTKLGDSKLSGDRSVVDYIYFDDGGSGLKQLRSEFGMPSWFWIDSAHLDEYEVQDLVE